MKVHVVLAIAVCFCTLSVQTFSQTAKTSAKISGKHPATEADVVASLKEISKQVGLLVTDVTDIQGYGNGNSGKFVNGIAHLLGNDYDVRRTDSLVSPYLGTVKLSFLCDYTLSHETIADAKADTAFRSDKYHTVSVTLLVTYAYQDGTWIRKDISSKGIAIAPNSTEDIEWQRWAKTLTKIIDSADPSSAE